MNAQTNSHTEAMQARFTRAWVRVKPMMQERIVAADKEAAAEALEDLVGYLAAGPCVYIKAPEVLDVQRLQNTRHDAVYVKWASCLMVTVSYEQLLETREGGEKWYTRRAIFGLDTVSGKFTQWEA